MAAHSDVRSVGLPLALRLPERRVGGPTDGDQIDPVERCRREAKIAGRYEGTTRI